MGSLRRYFYFIASLVLTCYALRASQSLISPLLASMIIALALDPLANRLEKLKIPRILSSVFCVVLLIVVIGCVTLFISLQVGSMNFKIVGDTYDGAFGKIQNLIKHFLNISFREQTSFIKEFYVSALKNGVYYINHTLSITANLLNSMVLFAISLFFMLYYRGFFVSFLFKAIHPKHHLILKKILGKTLTVVKNYVFGLSLIILMTGILNSAGLLIMGVENAIIFGVIAAILTLIPYIGIMIGSILPMIFVLFTKDSLWYPVGVLAVFMIVQFLEGNFLTPNIVGKSVSINPFMAIWGLVLGWSLLGMVGILFALPLLAICKVIFDEISVLKPLGYIIGKAH